MVDSANHFFSVYIEKFLSGNKAARELAESLRQCGVGLMPLVDHCTIRTHDVNERAREVTELGFEYDQDIGVLEFGNWWAKVYRKPGYPSLFIDQAFAGDQGKGSLIPEWVDAHGDHCFHHIAVLVEEIDTAIVTLQDKGIGFAGKVVGDKGTHLRQVFTLPEVLRGNVFTAIPAS